jgi:hypothetical protein
MSSDNKIKLQNFITRITSWRPVLIIALLLLLVDLISGSKIYLSLIFAQTLFFTILYHLLISLPLSTILFNIKSKVLKVFLHLITLFTLFILLVVFVGIPIYEAVQEDERKYNSGQGYTIIETHKQEVIRVK